METCAASQAVAFFPAPPPFAALGDSRAPLLDRPRDGDGVRAYPWASALEGSLWGLVFGARFDDAVAGVVAGAVVASAATLAARALGDRAPAALARAARDVFGPCLAALSLASCVPGFDALPGLAAGVRELLALATG